MHVVEIGMNVYLILHDGWSVFRELQNGAVVLLTGPIPKGEEGIQECGTTPDWLVAGSTNKETYITGFYGRPQDKSLQLRARI